MPGPVPLRYRRYDMTTAQRESLRPVRMWSSAVLKDCVDATVRGSSVVQLAPGAREGTFHTSSCQ